MSAAPTQIAVVQTASNLGTNSAQIQKDFLEEPLARQNSVGNRARGGLKGKHLTRSHAMRESTSPPRTPTPRLSTSPLATVATVQTNTISGCNNTQSSDNLNDSSISSIKSTTNYIQTGTSISPPIMIEQSPPHVIITTQNIQQSQQQQQNQNHSNVVIYTTNDLSPSNSGVICNDVDFPKLTPPKSSKGTRNMNNNNNNNNVNRDLMAIDNKHNSTTGNDHKLSPSSLSSSSSLSSPPSTSSMVVVTTTMMTSATTPDTQQQQNYFNGNKKNNCIINVDKTTTTAATINGNQQPTQNSNRVHSPSTNRNLSENFTTSTTTTSSSLHNNNNNNSNNNNNNNNNGNGGNINHINNSGNHSHINQSQQQLSSPPIITSYDKENRCPRNESQNSNNSGTYSQDENHNNNHNNNNNNNCLNENQIDNSGKSDRLGKKHRNGANSKGSKPRLKNMSGSSSSMEGGNSTSGFISRDSSTEQFTDQSGVDLLQFFKDTLNKNPKDRNMLVKIENDLLELAHDKAVEMRFPAMSSYNRMLIHRVAAFFGMEHNVDQVTQQCVIVAPTKATRIPDIRFKTLFRERMTDEPRKSILKRDVHSFDDCRQSYLSCPDRGVLDRKAKSFEEREEEYEKIRRKIFLEGDDEQQQYWHYANNGGNNNDQSAARLRQNNKLLKVQSLPIDRHGGRPSVSKAHSFGGYGGPPQSGGPLLRGDSVNSNKSAGPRLFKQDSVSSTNQSWRLSPSSSGYKTQTQSLRSDSVTPSPTGYGSDDHTPEPSLVQSPPAAASSCGVVWAVTDMASVPRGSVLINPQTLQPIVNQDGSIYHFDPSNLPPSQAVTSGMYNSNHNNNNNINNTNNNHNKNIGGVPSINRKKHNNNDNNNRQQQRNHNYNNNNKIQENNIIQYSNSSSSTSSGSNELNCNSIINNVQTISISTSTGTSNNESSIETLSETSSSAQTVVNINQNNNNNNNTSIENESEDIPIITKENINRDMDDIEEEIVSNNYEDNNDKTTLKIDNVQQEKPKFINQATSPNIPTPEPDEISSPITVPVPNEIIKATTKISSINDNQTNNNVTIINASTRSTPITTVSLDIRKDDLKSTNQTNLPIMSYTTSYQTIDGTTVFQPAGSATPYSTTTYQQGPDGSVYAVPQQMVYTYPQQMDGEIQGYFVYDQSAGPRDNSGLIAAPGQTIYQSTPGGAVVPVATYPTQTPYGNGPIYQQQVVYSPEQFSNGAATAAAQMQQYPVTTYPVGYSYPYNGYWGQTMAYYVPQPAIANAVQSSILPPPSLPIVSGTQAIGNGQTQLINPNNNGTPGIIVHGGSSVTAGGKQRNTPPHHHQQQQHHHHHHHHQHHNSHQQQHHQQNLSSGQSSQSTTPATTNTTYQFAAAGLPVAIASDQNGQPMYIPQSAVFPNMLPYGPPNAQSTPAGVLTHLPPQPNTVINPMISHPGGSISSGGPPPLHIPMEQPVPAQHQPPQQQQQSSNYTTISTNSSHGGGSISGNRSCTPQSAPSTPLSNPLPLSAHHQRNNPPLFATPPMIPNGFNSHIANYQNYAESQQLGGVSSAGGISNYEKKNSYSIGKKTGGGSSNSSGYSSNNRQNSYNSNQQRKTHENPTNTIHNYSGGNTGNTNNSTNTRQIYASQQKKPPSGNSSLSSNNGGGGGGGNNTSLMNSNVNHNNNNNSMSNTSSSAQNNNNTDIKSRPGGIRQKPGNLDFKRNGSQRNSPSTNSTESNNNSPNSIASNHNHMSGSSSGNNSTTGCGPVTDHHHNNHHHHHHQHHQIQHSNQQQQQYHHSHQQQQQSQTMYMTRGTHIPPMHQSTTAAAVVAAAAAAAANDAAAACHQPLIGAYNHPAPGGMYFKYGQTYFAHPSVALPNNRRSPPNDIRPSLAPLYPTVNMMLPAPRQMQPRHPNPNYKGNKPSR